MSSARGEDRIFALQFGLGLLDLTFVPHSPCLGVLPRIRGAMMTTDQETPFPQELASMGRPQQIHKVVVYPMSLLLLCAGVFFLLAAGLMVFIYLKVPFKKDDPT